MNLNSKSETLNSKQITNSKPRTPNLRLTRFGALKFKTWCLFSIFIPALFTLNCFAQQNSDLEFTLDVTSETTPLPKIFKPNIDLSGRGFNRDQSWPQELSAKQVIDQWQKDIGFGGMYRLQYNLWEINQLSKNSDLQKNLLANYEAVIKNITDAGGTVILDIFGTPAGLGKVLDKKSPPWDLRAFKELVKDTMRLLSCVKKYNVWYEVWNAPDLDDFFLGRKQEYLNLYRVVAESAKELEKETKVHIPVGGPSVSWWFQNLDGNTTVSPERSLIYELIKFCYHYRLPLNFISWHAYSTDPNADVENTIYRKSAVTLIRDWLSYFNLDRNTFLIVDEWNYDRTANLLPERMEKAYISASYIPSRLDKMHTAGIDYQVIFSLEDFQNNKEGVERNIGVFSFDSEHPEYKGSPKVNYNVLRMLNLLGQEKFDIKLDDDFAGVIATRSADSIILMVYSFIDPDIVKNYLSRNIGALKPSERKVLLKIVGSDSLIKIMVGKLDIRGLRATVKVKNLLRKCQELLGRAKKFETTPRNMKINIKGLKDSYLYERYAMDSSCSLNCAFVPVEKKEVSLTESYQETLNLNPYSVHLIVLKPKPKETQTADAPEAQVTPQLNKGEVAH
jgi:hypothetical protein